MKRVVALLALAGTAQAAATVSIIPADQLAEETAAEVEALSQIEEAMPMVPLAEAMPQPLPQPQAMMPSDGELLSHGVHPLCVEALDECKRQCGCHKNIHQFECDVIQTGVQVQCACDVSKMMNHQMMPRPAEMPVVQEIPLLDLAPFMGRRFGPPQVFTARSPMDAFDQMFNQMLQPVQAMFAEPMLRAEAAPRVAMLQQQPTFIAPPRQLPSLDDLMASLFGATRVGGPVPAHVDIEIELDVDSDSLALDDATLDDVIEEELAAGLFELDDLYYDDLSELIQQDLEAEYMEQLREDELTALMKANMEAHQFQASGDVAHMFLQEPAAAEVTSGDAEADGPTADEAMWCQTLLAVGTMFLLAVLSSYVITYVCKCIFCRHTLAKKAEPEDEEEMDALYERMPVDVTVPLLQTARMDEQVEEPAVVAAPVIVVAAMPSESAPLLPLDREHAVN